MPVALKHRVISRQEKLAFSAPVGLPWDSHPPPTECADGRTCGCTDVRTYGCTDVRTDGHVTITSQPQFLGLIGYHISLAMELRWRALPAGSAINKDRVTLLEGAKSKEYFLLLETSGNAELALTFWPSWSITVACFLRFNAKRSVNHCFIYNSIEMKF